jgi:hypothetical protein
MITPTANLDQDGACFDKLSMRVFLCAIKTLPHPELVEGRTGGDAILRRGVA